MCSCSKQEVADKDRPEEKRKDSFASQVDKNGVMELSEEFFMLQVSDIYVNTEDYSDVIIRVAGIFSYFKGPDGLENIPVVYRFGPGCCGNDGIVGFMLNFPPDMERPEKDDWIIVEGKAEKKEENVYLKVKAYEVSDKRGNEYVNH